MTESPRAAAPPAAPRSEAAERLRRFHFGDPTDAPAPISEELLPASMHPFRGASVRGGWPLVVDPSGGGALARPLGEHLDQLGRRDERRSLAENLTRLERRLAAALGAGPAAPAREVLAIAAAQVAEELALPAGERRTFEAGVVELVAALPAGALLLPFGRRAPLALATLAARRRLDSARAAFAAEAHELAATADALLAADRARRPGGIAAAERAGELGAFGGQLLDADRLSGVVSRRRAGEPLDDRRRERLTSARAALAAFEERAPEPLWVVPAGEEGEDLLTGVRIAADPCAAAVQLFDDAAAPVLALARAVRVVRLEAAEAFQPERHLPWLDRLDWRSLAPAELALVRPVLALLSTRDLVPAGLASLTGLLISGRPIQVFLLGSDLAPAARAAFRFEPAYFALGHREVFVHQGSPARPQPLATGLTRALAAPRAALHVVDAPPPGPPDVDPWLVAAARVTGRAAPLFRYDPEAGSSWARRLGFEDNPDPAADWPREPLPESAAAAGAPADAPFTFADAALLDPSWRHAFAPAEEALAEELVPLAEWLELADDEAVRRLPFVWAAGRDGAPVRLVVDRALAQATLDRLAFWRTLEELAGVRSEHVEEAAARARREAEERAERERRELERRHAEQLEQARADADARAVDHLVAALFEVEPTLSPLAPPLAAATAPAGAAAAPAVSTGVATAEVAAAAVAEPTPAVEEPSDEPVEPWIDTPLCTSCDECIRKSPGIFAYNGNKQAYVKNARGGSFRELVIAAEACTAKIIHPGTPWNPAEPDLATWTERARAFH